MSATSFSSILNLKGGALPVVEVGFSWLGHRQIKVAGTGDSLHSFAEKMLLEHNDEIRRDLQQLYIQSDAIAKKGSFLFQLLIQLQEQVNPKIALIRDQVFRVLSPASQLQEALRACGGGVYLSSLEGRRETRPAAATPKEERPPRRLTPIAEEIDPIDIKNIDWRLLKENLGLEVALRFEHPIIVQPIEDLHIPRKLTTIVQTIFLLKKKTHYKDLRDAKELLGVETELRGINWSLPANTQQEKNDLFNLGVRGRSSSVSTDGKRTPPPASFPDLRQFNRPKENSTSGRKSA